MAIAHVELMIQDPEVAEVKTIPITEGIDIADEDFFLNGPVSRRAAVLDFDPSTGQLTPGASYQPPAPGRLIGKYAPADPHNIYAADFMQINVFGTVFNTIHMFERAENLGRRVQWGFDGPQLLVIPRAGRWENAFYERESRSLQFFYFEADGRQIQTSLSRDIVAHETGHAILDGINPSLYDAITPQSLALHEAIADLSALFVALLSDDLREAVLDHSQLSIKESSAFSSIAEEFGKRLHPEKGGGPLRNLLNDLTMDDVRGDDPHELCNVVTGALYRVLVSIHEAYRQRYAEAGMAARPAAGKALALAGNKLRRMVIRGLDYLPPGDVSFADFGRAIIAADTAAHPDNDEERQWIIDQFVLRKMAPDEAAMREGTGDSSRKLEGADPQTLLESDWAAYQFANQSDARRLLKIAPDVPFRVLPRLEARKTIFLGESKRGETHECLFKVAWDYTEPNAGGSVLPRFRHVTAGTTLVIDWDTGTVRARLSTDRSGQQRDGRDRMLLRLLDEGVIRVGRQALATDGKPLRGAIQAARIGDTMQVRGIARALHIAKPSDGTSAR